MRLFRKKQVQAAEEESVFVTMTDLTISFLLIVMILLAFFAILVDREDTVPLSDYEQVERERDAALTERNRLAREVERHLARIRYLEERVRFLEAALADMTLERDRLRRENEENLVLIRKLKEEVAWLRQRLATVTAELDALKAELEKLKQMQRVNPLEAYQSRAAAERRIILIRLRNQLKEEFPDLKVEVSPEGDALRFQGEVPPLSEERLLVDSELPVEGLFRSGEFKLEDHERGIVEALGTFIHKILPCYTFGRRELFGPDCNRGNALIDAVHIEGHTDSDGEDVYNLRLSTDRANETFLAMLRKETDILAHENIRGQPVMSVAGYGEMRPIETNQTEEGKASNRRIDLRISMYAPSSVKKLEELDLLIDQRRKAGASQ